ncbi:MULTISPECIES: TylF/MycF/NovP-related O-methyltransferase [unclassified Ruegeria]|uniref:TylF/MycF/NovP-related O-methyltransferase n=1 Tax=unclassified Ruegeria TaxID=2625375 RepID=UPI00148960B3|nr:MULTISPECIES: TylF/MycF/NovP-related O-methyltransferase [unclassified Ruegeria]NOD77937.1 macrocin O-methyltransferase [Ruegeria sp. HKCCD4332]
MFHDLREKYLTTVARTLDGTIYEDPPILIGDTKPDYNPVNREHGWDWPSVAFTMVGSKRLANVRTLVESVIGNKVPGDFVETGVWRGGASIFAKAVLFAYGINDRRVVLCDSFQGLPEPNEDLYPHDKGSDFHKYDALAVSADAVRSNFEKFDLLDDQVVFIEGFFKDTMPLVPSKQIAVLRLDGDMYESTIDPLKHLFGKISKGGWIIVDDYHVVPAAKAAVHDYFDEIGYTPPAIHEIDGVGVFFQKTR